MIPVVDLMQTQHPGYLSFLSGENMEKSQYPLFFDYCVKVTERFRYHAFKEANVLVNEDSLMHIIDCVKQLDDTDEPEIVLPLREQIRHSCYNYLEHCEEMGTKFTTPSTVPLFYRNIGKLVMLTSFNFAGVQHE